MPWPPWLSQNEYYFWDAAVKAIGAAAVAGSGIWAIRQYVSTGEREARKKLWEKQLDLYFEACQLASTIAMHERGNPVRTAAETRFYELNFGQLAVIEDDFNVERETELFRRSIEANADMETLIGASVNLAHACRTSIATTYNRRLENLTQFSQTPKFSKVIRGKPESTVGP